jgi:hypothetical protein
VTNRHKAAQACLPLQDAANLFGNSASVPPSHPSQQVPHSVAF